MIRLIRKEAPENMARFYLIQIVPGLFGERGVLREWGRIGRAGSVRNDWYPVQEAAQQEASDTLLEKKFMRGATHRECSMTPNNNQGKTR